MVNLNSSRVSSPLLVFHAERRMHHFGSAEPQHTSLVPVLLILLAVVAVAKLDALRGIWANRNRALPGQPWLSASKGKGISAKGTPAKATPASAKGTPMRKR